MKRTMMKLADLIPTEDVQDCGRVSLIAGALEPTSEIDWDAQPAIIADEEGNILDGHHRHAAAVAVGLEVWPVIVVVRSDWDRHHNCQAAAMWACEQAEDHVTWGAVAN